MKDHANERQRPLVNEECSPLIVIFLSRAPTNTRSNTRFHTTRAVLDSLDFYTRPFNAPYPAPKNLKVGSLSELNFSEN